MAEQVGGIYYEVGLDTGKLIDDSRKVDRELSSVAGKFSIVAAAVAALAAGMVALRLAKLADEFRLLSARVEVAAGSVEAGAAAFDALVKVSRSTQSSLAGNIEVFNRLNQSILQMGGSQDDTLKVTELLAKAIKVSGASAVEAKAAMLQFGQALGSGKLAGDELRSLLETAPYLMRQLADGIGVPVGALKQLGEEGKLTADVVTNALTQAAERIDADFKKFPQTIESAMVVARDAAALAILEFDKLSGTSAALTGIATGLGESLDGVAQQFMAANREAGTLGRNDAVRSWADGSRVALSYLIDAADVVWQTLSVLGRNVAFVFRGIGSEIGGIGAQVRAVMNGDFAQARAIGEAMRADAAQRRAELDAADARTLGRGKLAGQAMRETWATNDAMRGIEDRGFTPARTSTLRPPAATGTGTAGSGGRAKKPGELHGPEPLKDTQYIADMEESFAKRLERWAEGNQLALDRAEEQARAKLAADQERHAMESSRAREGAQADIVGGQNDPAAAVAFYYARRAEELARQREAELLTQAEYDATVLANAQTLQNELLQIAQQRVQSESDMQQVMLSSVGSFFGAAADMAKQHGDEMSGTYRAMFALAKGFAIASGTVALYSAALKALDDPTAITLPQKLANYAAVFAAGSSLLSTISSVSYGGGRQYGGPVSAGSLYRVNEGGAPEMFMGSNGSQYLMPTQAGKVIPADQVGGSGNAPTVIIQNMGQPVAVQSQSWDQQSNTMRLTIAEMSRQVRENEGPFWSAMRGSTNVRGTL